MSQGTSSFSSQLRRYYTWYTGGFVIFILVLALLEKLGLDKRVMGYIFMFATIALYAGIGLLSRTADVAEYYVAGRKVPAIFNGMATGADWMSAASFLGMAGGLYLQGFDGLAYVMGWTGGYCLVALFLAPYLRKFGQFTIPDFLGARYGGNLARSIGVAAAIVCSFVYVVAQIYGVGIITSRFTGVEFSVGVFLGLAGVLVCSFLGGMRAVTWTQVAQYIILIIAYLIPVVWLSVQQTGNPIPQLAYGHVLEKVSEREKDLANDPKEIEVRQIHEQRARQFAEQIAQLPTSWDAGITEARKKVDQLRANHASLFEIKIAERALQDYPKSPEEARVRWHQAMQGAHALAAAPLPHAEPFPAKDEAGSNIKRWNFLALVFCLMLGTAGLPHILMRYYTTPSVQDARMSVFWSLFFITLLYITAPALAVLVKFDIFTHIVGSKFSELPSWAAAWSKVDSSLLSIIDLNKDNIVQLAEITLGQDVIVLATPEIAGLPYVISGLVAAGGLAAALSTADGLLLTISSALSHDVYYKMIDPAATTHKRVTISKVILLVVALLAAYVTSLKPGDILAMVVIAFSFAAAAFFPALVLGIFWKRASKWGAVTGMCTGLAVTVYYVITRYPFFQQKLGIDPTTVQLWFDIQPISAGVFGVPVGMLTILIVSLLTPAPDEDTQRFVEHVRYPSVRRG